MDSPHFSVTAPVDVTRLVAQCKEKDLSFFKCFLFLAVHTANDIPEFRQRIRGNQVVEHDIAHPSYTSMSQDHLFTFTDVKFDPDPRIFFENAEKTEALVKSNATLVDQPGRDDYFFITSLPWISFTSFTHPMHYHPIDSVPRLCWGKYYKENGKVMLPFGVQAHHALVDGWHIGQYFKQLEEHLQLTTSIFSK